MSLILLTLNKLNLTNSILCNFSQLLVLIFLLCHTFFIACKIYFTQTVILI